MACEALGIRFQPMVREKTGACAPEALEVMQLVCNAAAAHTGIDHASLLQDTLVRCAASIRRANARAVLSRAAECPTQQGTAILEASTLLLPES